MINTGIKDLKNNLSRLLSQVKEGEEILITDRGKPVARIVKEEKDVNSIRNSLGSLAQKGLIALPSRSVVKKNIAPIKVTGKHVSEMVIEDRR